MATPDWDRLTAALAAARIPTDIPDVPATRRPEVLLHLMVTELRAARVLVSEDLRRTLVHLAHMGPEIALTFAWCIRHAASRTAALSADHHRNGSCCRLIPGDL